MGKQSFRILLMVLGIVALSLVFGSAESQAKDQMVFASWGGTYQDAIRTAWIKPFQQKFGVEVTEDTSPEMAKIKAMVDTNTVTWDVVTGGGANLVEGIHKGFFEKLPSEKVNQSQSYPQARQEFAAPSEIFSTLFAFSLKEFPEGKPQPKSWADFWDVKKFPGKRSFYSRRPATGLEIALMADGVSPADVYKILKTQAGVDRAFKKIEELKPQVGVWWTSGAAPVQALGSGEVVMATGWNGRFQGGIDQGLPIRQVWDGAVAQVGYFMVVKGAPNKETAFKFLNWIVSPEAQAEFYKYVAYGPTSPEAWKYIPKKEWDRLPSSPQNLERTIFLDEPWWFENEAKMLERWQALLSK